MSITIDEALHQIKLTTLAELCTHIGLGPWILLSLQILVFPDARVISSPVNHS